MALLEGARLAERLDDDGAAKYYRQQAKALEAAITRHWDKEKGYLVVTLDREGMVVVCGEPEP